MRTTAVLFLALVLLAACGADDPSELTAAEVDRSPTAGDEGNGAESPASTTAQATEPEPQGEPEPSAEPAEPSPQRYTVTATVLEDRGHGPQLCLGGVATSLPPQCGGPDIVGWDWALVEDEESASGTTWGTYSMVGTWDGSRFTLTEPPGPPAHEPGREIGFSTPCDPPPGGWAVRDESTATQEGLDAALSYANAQPGYAGGWIDQSINPASHQEPIDEHAMNDPRKLVLNLRFTGDLSVHDREVTSRWGGAFCLIEATHSLAELRAIEHALREELQPLSSSVNEVAGVVEISVIVVEEGQQEAIDERYGPGLVELHGELRPVGAD